MAFRDPRMPTKREGRKGATVGLPSLMPLSLTSVVLTKTANPDDCNISKSFGTFKAVTAESWLLFEDETGTLRAVDYGCRVQRVIKRQ
jgi:hypothetical protein